MDYASERTITVTLQIDSSGQARVVDQLATSQESAKLFLEKSKPQSAPFDVPFDATYKDRKGYDEKFLGNKRVVLLPKLSPALEQIATKVLGTKANDAPFQLKYHHFSVVMHSKRRFALYSAANVDFSGRYEMSRPPDVWREDPRIPLESQVTGYYYYKNQFDRGHLTRREDLEYGTTRKAALQAAADTCHWTNCAPEHSKFNQGKQLWQGIERHVLEDAIERDSFRAQVITGPVLQPDDPTWERFQDVQYPVKFWKIVSAVNAAGDLFATAYILDQTDVIAEFGIEAAPLVPFTPYKTFQVPIAEVERLTQLSFLAVVDGKDAQLSDFDPLRAGTRRPKSRARVRPEEAALLADTPESYRPLTSLEDIVR